MGVVGWVEGLGLGRPAVLGGLPARAIVCWLERSMRVLAVPTALKTTWVLGWRRSVCSLMVCANMLSWLLASVGSVACLHATRTARALVAT